MTAETIDLEALEGRARADISAAGDLQALTGVRASYLGKKGSLADLLRSIGGLEPSERARVGQGANAAKQRIEELVAARRDELERARRALALAGESLDVTLPGAAPAPGHLHPITHVTRDMVRFFTRSRRSTTTSRRSTFRRTTRRVTSRTPSTSTTATCCARIPRTCRSA